MRDTLSRRRPQQTGKKRTSDGRVVHRRGNRWDILKLSRIYREQRGLQRNYHYLTDDDVGRAFLTAFLHCGLSVEDAQERAPWLDATEMKALKLAAYKLAFDDIGGLIKLRHDDWLRFKAWRYWPCDKSREEVERLRLERKREKARISRQKRQAMWVGLTKADRREDFIMKVLEEGPTTMPKLFKRARRSPAFGPVNLGYGARWDKRRGHVVREFVRRVVNRLVALGVVERGPGKAVQMTDFNVETRPAKRTQSVAFETHHPSVAFAIGRNHRRHKGLTPVLENVGVVLLQGQERTLATRRVEAAGTSVRNGEERSIYHNAPTKRHQREVAIRGRTSPEDVAELDQQPTQQVETGRQSHKGKGSRPPATQKGRKDDKPLPLEVRAAAEARAAARTKEIVPADGDLHEVERTYVSAEKDMPLRADGSVSPEFVAWAGELATFDDIVLVETLSTRH